VRGETLGVGLDGIETMDCECVNFGSIRAPLTGSLEDALYMNQMQHQTVSLGLRLIIKFTGLQVEGNVH
jgi:hypothetical protein